MGSRPRAPASRLVLRWPLSCALGCSGLRGPFAIIARPQMTISAMHSVCVTLHSVWLLFAFDSLSYHFAISTLIQFLLC